MTKYYFAYGSNLNIGQMMHRCPTSQPVGSLLLSNWQLVFRGVADIVPCKGSFVSGGIYTLQPSDEIALDRYEGFRADQPWTGMYRKESISFLINGKERQALIYVMNSHTLAPPSEYYYRIIETGYADFKLETNSLLTALRHSLSGVQYNYRRDGQIRRERLSKNKAACAQRSLVF